MDLIPWERMVSFLFQMELESNHYWENKLRLGKKEKKPAYLLALKDLGFLHTYFILLCSCHIHLELLTCSSCCLQPFPVRDHVLAGTGWPCPCGWGELRKSFCSFGSLVLYQNRAEKAPFTCTRCYCKVLLVQGEKMCVLDSHRSSLPCHLKEPKQTSDPVPAPWTWMMRRTAKLEPDLSQDAWSFCLTSGFH